MFESVMPGRALLPYRAVAKCDFVLPQLLLCMLRHYYVIGICVRRTERENECIKKLDEHVRLFCRTYNTGYAE